MSGWEFTITNFFSVVPWSTKSGSNEKKWWSLLEDPKVHNGSDIWTFAEKYELQKITRKPKNQRTFKTFGICLWTRYNFKWLESVVHFLNHTAGNFKACDGIAFQWIFQWLRRKKFSFPKPKKLKRQQLSTSQEKKTNLPAKFFNSLINACINFGGKVPLLIVH